MVPACQAGSSTSEHTSWLIMTSSVAQADHCVCREILDIEQITDESMGLELTEDNIDDVLDEIRPYLVGETLSHCFLLCCVRAGNGRMCASITRSSCRPSQGSVRGTAALLGIVRCINHSQATLSSCRPQQNSARGTAALHCAQVS